jgi:hypothetical protein
LAVLEIFVSGDCLLIRSAHLSISVVPEVGGKITQIEDHRTGHKLLVPPQKPLCPIPLKASWLDYDIGGMDDCFPNIAEELYPDPPWFGTMLPDHGEWSRCSWDVVSYGADYVVLKRTGELLPYVAQKTVRFLDNNTIEFAYFVKNRGDAPLRYLWAAHPLITVAGSFELSLPTGPMTFTIFPADGRIYEWPRFGWIDLTREWLPAGRTLKAFIIGLREGWCMLETESHRFQFTFDLATTPMLGVWFNNDGFPSGDTCPFRCIALEPSTSASDSLRALARTEYPSISAGAVAEWSFQLCISSSP